MGLTDSAGVHFQLPWSTLGYGCGAGPIQRTCEEGAGLDWGWTCGEPLSRGLVGERRGAGRTHGMLRSTSAHLRPGTQSRPQVVQLLPFSSSLYTSAWRNL